ncbi:hypothetical protein DPSP01_002408 [Paraphaeosphaeria sporulosa]|uniref:Small secreted protein n=1 Tax=Paraphaeosphaeria sporulosa TaxID=1460663 RepID=A0A177C0V8_9PLEO|nr:uncharacterized protein CC84DRAFT_1101775 [Paraphaeosphaeria sporulosa]OAG01125.1 hypothetical protein CC84DRAFT_1101775 [Paraphaeosphaeria sporulosa]
MRFSSSAIVSALLATGALAAPTPLTKRAGVLTAKSYADFQVSDGVAGNALAEVQAKFPIDTSNLANVDPADAKIISDARQTAESAETDAFNPAIAAASGDAATALQNGKIKNKVLKLQLEVLDLGISAAQSGKDNSAKIAQEQKKLDNNIATDKKNAGQASKSVQFSG